MILSELGHCDIWNRDIFDDFDNSASYECLIPETQYYFASFPIHFPRSSGWVEITLYVENVIVYYCRVSNVIINDDPVFPVRAPCPPTIIESTTGIKMDLSNSDTGNHVILIGVGAAGRITSLIT